MDLSVSAMYRTETEERFVSSSKISPRKSFDQFSEDRSPSNEILRGLAPDLKRLIEPALKTVALRKEQYIYQQDERIEFVYFPLTAVVSEFKILEDGRMVEIAVSGHEGAVGLSSIMSGLDRAIHQTQVSQAGLAKRMDVTFFRKLSRSHMDLTASLNSCN